MKNNLVTKVIYRSIFCTISFFAILFMTGFFSVGGQDYATFTGDLFYFYTNLSNFMCFGVIIACLHDDARQLRAGNLSGYNRNPYLRHLKHMTTIIISITLIAYGILLGKPNTISFWNNIGNLCYHVVCPIMFIVDTVMFDEHKSVGYLEPVVSLVLPIIYVVVIEIIGTNTGRFPYFFLNMDELGIGGLMMWMGILLGLFLIIGYLLFLHDKFVKVDGKWKLDFSGTRPFGDLTKKKE